MSRPFILGRDMGSLWVDKYKVERELICLYVLLGKMLPVSGGTTIGRMVQFLVVTPIL